jgi:hypothetical protein
MKLVNKTVFQILVFMATMFSFCQTAKTIAIPDSLFREDQFYATLSYNLMQKKPAGFGQNGFSSGIHFGFIRDIPLNKTRKWAVGLGLGYGYQNLKQNIKITERNGTFSYSIQSGFDKNRLVIHSVEVPLEVRWRNATPQSHRFWRIYTGFKFSYAFSSNFVHESATENYKIKTVEAIDRLQYGPYLSVGYNGFNAYVYYGLNPIFKDAKIENQDLLLNSFNLGLQFYIL